jgi:tetratricopeptide (TPR) repeat protein
MRSLRLRVAHLILAACCILLGGAFAQDRVPDTIRMKDRTTLKGYATAYDASTQILKFHTVDGRDLDIPLSDLNTLSVYQVTQSTIPKDNARAQLQLANYARDAELFAHALRHYGYAEKADPSLKPEIDKQRAILRQKAGNFALLNAQTALRHGDDAEAKKWLTKIVEKLPEEPQAAEAAKLLDQMFQRSPKATMTVAKDSRGDLEKDLAPSKAAYESMLEKTRKGLTVANAGTQATNLWQSAIADGERALKNLDKLDKDYTDGRSRETLGTARKMVTDQMVELRLHLASVWTTRSSYNKALGEVNNALALDPRNRDALEARARIEEASSRGFGWWY